MSYQLTSYSYLVNIFLNQYSFQCTYVQYYRSCFAVQSVINNNCGPVYDAIMHSAITKLSVTDSRSVSVDLEL